MRSVNTPLFGRTRRSHGSAWRASEQNVAPAWAVRKFLQSLEPAVVPEPPELPRESLVPTSDPAPACFASSYAQLSTAEHRVLLERDLLTRMYGEESPW